MCGSRVSRSVVPSRGVSKIKSVMTCIIRSASATAAVITDQKVAVLHQREKEDVAVTAALSVPGVLVQLTRSGVFMRNMLN